MKSLELSSEQTLRLEELREALHETLTDDQADSMDYPVVQFSGCDAVCMPGCTGGCTTACNSKCYIACTNACYDNCYSFSTH